MNPEQDPPTTDSSGRPLNLPPNYDDGKMPSHVTTMPESLPGQDYNPQLRVQYANEPQVVHATRPFEPPMLAIGPETKKHHDESVQKYPELNLSEGEFIILDVKRHPIGLLGPLLAGGIVLFALAVGLVVYPVDPSALNLPGFGAATLIIGLLMALVGLGTFVAVWVYLQNEFFLTNESVIQELQYSLFSRREQVVSLGSIEDASYTQNGILQTMLNYGSIRLSTEGEETTYRFSYVANPREQVKVLNDAIEAFKNGRPVDPYEN